LSCRANVDALVGNLKARLNLVRAVAGANFGCSAAVIRSTYQAVVESRMRYALCTQVAASVKVLAKLQIIQNAGARLITGLPKQTPADLVLRESGLKPINYLLDLAIIGWTLRAQSLPFTHVAQLTLDDWTGLRKLKKRAPLHRFDDVMVELSGLLPDALPQCSTTRVVPYRDPIDRHCAVFDSVRLDIGQGVMKKDGNEKEFKRCAENTLSGFG
ncbi:hypothetical protein Pmar_PMAR001316, partial [Perkinsus marinus ATCC 50983]